VTTLLLRLAGPMQSWGTQSRFTERDTGSEPSKSGVIGLLCAALGRPRDAPVDDLAALRMGVRVDREGVPLVDYQTAGGTHGRGASYGVRKADGSRGDTVVSRRHYLADADFLVGLEGETALIRLAHAALERPRWQLFLGRKGYVPGEPAWLPDGLRLDETLEAALGMGPGGQDVGARQRFVVETVDGVEVRRDQPFGAAFLTRQFGTRAVTTVFQAVVAPTRDGSE
jgi:CRISPR system Cascade subunit CasD